MDARSEQGTGKLRAAIEYEDNDGACRDRGSVCVLVRPERKVEDVAYIRNIVYPPLLSRL